MLDLAMIFSDTQKLCREDASLSAAIRHTIDRQYVVLKPQDVKPKPAQHRFTAPASVIVSQKRSFEAAKSYPDDRVCVLNFASAKHPGGGVHRGAKAQEECLCRCSSLYFTISDPSAEHNFHFRHRRMAQEGKLSALYNDDCIFSPGIVVVKTDTNFPQRLPIDERYAVDVITCAAPNLHALARAPHITDEALKALHITRARRILDIAVSEEEDVLILGAFGCGAFQNPPAVVAEAYRTAIQSYLYDFKTIEFAVYCPPHDTRNYQTFQRILT